MRQATALIALFVSSFWGTDALKTPYPQKREPRVVHLPLQRRPIQDPAAHDRQRLAKRKDIIQVTLDNLQYLYSFTASLGTPSQTFRLQLDTGSSDLWVNAPDSELCDYPFYLCQASGTYKANSSSTYQYLDSQFMIFYADGTYAAGDYATDMFRFQDIDISKLRFGIGYQSTSEEGVLGIGYSENEIQAVRQAKKPYENLPARLVADGHIATNAYSIWLDNINSATGSLLFGGVDKSQYHGSLITLPIQKAGPTYREFLITMTGLQVGSQTIDESMAMAVLLDTGSTLTYLPDDLVKSIYAEVNATWVDESHRAVVSCASAQSNTNITFHFSKPASISVSMKELILPFHDANGRQARLADGSAACIFGIFPSGDEGGVLGETFLRSAYVVYDLHNNEISLAQSNFDAKPTGSNVVEIGPGKKAIPDATAAPSPVAAKSGLPLHNGVATTLPSRRYYLGAALVAMLASHILVCF